MVFFFVIGLAFLFFIMRNPCFYIRLRMRGEPWYRKWIESRESWSSLKGVWWMVLYFLIGAWVLGVMAFWGINFSLF